jgi:uncharacterized membrane protein
MQTVNTSTRLWEVDTLRGIAIVLMVFFHFAWDLDTFGGYAIDILSPPWQAFARFIATIFIFVMGVSLTLSHHRAKQQAGQSMLFKKYLRRGGQIFGLGLAITVVTYFSFRGHNFVIFGILHLLGLSIILAYPFLHWNKWVSFGTGLGVIGLGVYADTLRVSYPWLIWLGVKQIGVSMADYYPFLPWFGIALLGVFAGYTFYPQGVRRFDWPDFGRVAPIRGLRFLGRYSLLIYLIHQPILIGLLIALGYGSF